MFLRAPSSAEELADELRRAAELNRSITVIGNNSKRLMAGPILATNVTISTSGLRRVLQYERDDLTVSAEAGMPFSELQALLTRQGQMIALDPPFAEQATVGGVVASNGSGPMRRAFGTARDLVIGMTFATLDGKLVSTGGMVVKNVAGLDMGKLMVGSFGTLGVMTSVNFRVHSLPPETRSFFYRYTNAESALEQRDAILRSVLRPLAVDLVSPPAATRLGLGGNHVLAIRVGGSERVLQRYAQELSGAEQFVGNQDQQLWQQIREFPADFLRRQPQGVVLRLSTKLSEMEAVFRLISGACIGRAASGITDIYLSSWQAVGPLWKAAAERSWSASIEFAPDDVREAKELWLLKESASAENTFAMMEKVKRLFDPGNLLNRSRLYGRI